MGNVLIQTGGGSKNNLVSLLSNKKFSLSQKDFEGCYAIGDYVFYNNAYVTKIDAPYGIMRIGEHAFDGCTELTEIHIPGSVYEIGDYALANCSKLTTIYYGGLESSWNDLPKGAHWNENTSGYTVVYAESNDCVTYLWYEGIGYAAQLKYNDSIKIAVIPDEYNSSPVVRLDVSYGHKPYTGVVVPSSITTIARGAFSGCELVSLTIPNSVNTIISDREGLPQYQSFCGPASAARALCGSQFSDSVNYFITRRDDYAVEGASGDHYIIIPDGTIEVPSDLKNFISFSSSSDDYQRQKIIIPDGVTTIGSNSITNVIYAEVPDSIISLPTDFFVKRHLFINKIKCNTRAAINVLNNYKNADVEALNVILVNSTSDDGQILDTNKMMSLTFDETIVDIDKFLGAPGLNTIYFNGSARYWFNLEKPHKYNLIYINGKLLGNNQNYRFPSNVSKVKLNSFPPTGGFTSIVLGDELYYFEGKIWDIRGPQPDDPSSVLSICTYYNNAYYLGSSTNSYLMLVKGSGTSCVIHPNCKIILGDAFRDNSSLQSVYIPNSVEFIGDYAFYNDVNVTLYDSNGNAYTSTNLNYIGEGAFGLIPNYVQVKQGETTIRNNTFIGGTTTDIMPSSIKMVGQFISSDTVCNYQGCLEQWLDIQGSSLTDAVVPPNISQLSDYSDTTLAAPFCKYHSLHLNSCKYNDSLYYTEISDVVIPETVVEIKNYAFALCDDLISIHIGNQVESIGIGAFAQCRNLTSIIYDGTISQWGAISLGSNWNYNIGTHTIHCTDGDIIL